MSPEQKSAIVAGDDSAKPIPSLWRPLRSATFRNLLIADIASDVGTFMQGVGAAWLMVSLNAGPLYIALTQTASALPFFVFALPAGAVGDIVDRRKLILTTEAWMATVGIALTVLTFSGLMSPLLLLVLTFALSAGDAFESPTWRAILPELVSNEDLAAASALNGIEFNFARAIGPALAGLLIAAAGVGTAFAINTASFVGVILVIARWKRRPRKLTVPAERFTGATVAAVRYVRYSPGLRSVIFRSGVVMFFASGLLALLPAVAHQVSRNPAGYGFLLGSFGLGAVLGALVIQRVRARWPAGAVMAIGVSVFGLSLIAAGRFHNLTSLNGIMLVAGAAWILFISLFNVITLNLTPDWIRARALAVSMLVIQGAMAAGSALWGAMATRTSVDEALTWAGIGSIAAAALGLLFKLPDATADLTPWIHWKLPAVAKADAAVADAGPALVTVEYDVAAEHQDAFVRAIRKYERIRRRDGAFRWGIYRDLENPDRYVETFLVDSWAEHLRQHERGTHADKELEDRVQALVRGEPVVRHLVSPR